MSSALWRCSCVTRRCLQPALSSLITATAQPTTRSALGILPHQMGHMGLATAPSADLRSDHSASPGYREAWVETSIANDSACGLIQLDPFVWGAPRRVDIVHSVVRWQLANRRQGTSMARTVSQIRGTGKKMYRQKGTGRARHGSARVNIFRGGAKAHGPVPRDHSFRLPRKVRQMALRVVLSAKYDSGDLIIVQDGSFESHKTQELVRVLQSRQLERSSLLFVDTELCNRLILASRNIKNCRVLTPSLLNTFDALKGRVMLCTVSAVRELEERLAQKHTLK